MIVAGGDFAQRDARNAAEAVEERAQRQAAKPTGLRRELYDLVGDRYLTVVLGAFCFFCLLALASISFITHTHSLSFLRILRRVPLMPASSYKGYSKETAARRAKAWKWCSFKPRNVGHQQAQRAGRDGSFRGQFCGPESGGGVRR